MTWIKFHDTLRKGRKRGLSRSTRFVFLELCHEVRPTRGTIELPAGMTDVDAVHDLLGGDKREVKEALADLTRPDPSNPDGCSMVVIDGADGARRLTIPSWGRRGENGEDPGSSTERARRHRARNAGNADATIVASTSQRASNDAATPSREEEKRIEEKREERARPVATPATPLHPPAPPSDQPRVPKSVKSDPRRSTCPTSVASNVAAWLAEHGIPQLRDPTHGADVARFLDHHAAKRSLFVDWAAAWRTWRARSAEYNSGGPRSTNGRVVQPMSDAWKPLRVDDPDHPLEKREPGSILPY